MSFDLKKYLAEGKLNEAENIRIILTRDHVFDINFFEKHARFLDGPRVEDYLIIPHGEHEIDCKPDKLKSCESYLKKNNIEYKIQGPSKG